MFIGETYSHCSQLRLNSNICTSKYLDKINIANIEMISVLGKYANIMDIMFCAPISYK